MTEGRAPLKVKRTVPGSRAGAHTLTALTGDETVDAVVEQYPPLRPALMSYGLCTCCSGNLSLRQTAAARGIPLDLLLSDLEQELAKGA